MSIHVFLKISPVGTASVGLLAETSPFTPREETTAVGCFWVGLCAAINEYVRSKGIEGFDCMKQYPDGHEAPTCPGCKGSGQSGSYYDDGSPRPCGYCNGEGLIVDIGLTLPDTQLGRAFAEEPQRSIVDAALHKIGSPASEG